MKNKTLLYVLSVVLLFAVFTGMAAPVSATTSATLSVADVQAYPGDSITIDVSLNGVTSGMQITLEYDPAVLTPEKIEAGPQCPSGWMTMHSNDLTMGRFVAVAGSLTNETINGVVAQYTYKVNSDAALGKSSLNVVTAIMTDAGTDFNATVSSHGSVTVVSSNGEDPSPSSGEDPVFPFTDVPERDWFYGDVYYVWENGLMDGTGEMLFSPNNTLTRGMVVTVLYRMEQKPSVDGVSNPFSDVKSDQYYTDAIIWAADKEIVFGYDGNRFGPEDYVTREQLATILYRYEKYSGNIPPNVVENIKFDDDDSISSYAKESVQNMTKQNIIRGKDNNLFEPASNATRAEYAAMLHRYLVAIE